MKKNLSGDIVYIPSWKNVLSVLQALIPLVVSVTFLVYILRVKHRIQRANNHRDNLTPYYYSIAPISDRCGLQDAFYRNDFMVGSHRSLISDDAQQQQQQQQQLSLAVDDQSSKNYCLWGLQQLYANKIHYLDLDLIYDRIQQVLVVAHPMEFTNKTHIYSPCAKQPLETVLQLLDQAMPNREWFVSLEPKANWERQEQGIDSVLQEPMLSLQQILVVVQKIKLQPTQCTLIIDANQINDEEISLVTDLREHCSFSLAMKGDNGMRAQEAAEVWNYEYVMPSIEYHPKHANYAATAGVEVLRHIQEQFIPKTIYWTVDTTEDLERVAQLQGFHGGIVSNRPIEMVRILTDKRYGWCPTKGVV